MFRCGVVARPRLRRPDRRISRPPGARSEAGRRRTAPSRRVTWSPRVSETCGPPPRRQEPEGREADPDLEPVVGDGVVGADQSVESGDDDDRPTLGDRQPGRGEVVPDDPGVAPPCGQCRRADERLIRLARPLEVGAGQAEQSSVATSRPAQRLHDRDSMRSPARHRTFRWRLTSRRRSRLRALLSDGGSRTASFVTASCWRTTVAGRQWGFRPRPSRPDARGRANVDTVTR